MFDSSDRILFLYLNTGAGHLGPAQALIAQIRDLYGDRAPELILEDALPPQKRFMRLVVEKGYWLASTVIPWTWGLIYHLSRLSVVSRVNYGSAQELAADYLARLLVERKITKVVSLHHIVGPSLEKAVRLINQPGLRRVTIVTDPFSVHPFWAFENRSPLVALSDTAAETLRSCLKKQGLDASRVHVAGPIVSTRFSTALAPSAVHQWKVEHGFDPDLPLVLLVGGAGGLPRGEKFLKGLCESGLRIQIALVCGKNTAQQAAASRIARRSEVPVTIYPFVPFTYELMNAADVILTKGGAGTVFEVLSLGKPLILTSYLYGQERGNVDYVVEQEFGWYAPRVRDALEHVRELLERPEQAQAMARRIAARVPANGTERVARFIAEEL